MINLYLSVLETDDDKNQFEQLYIKYKDKMYSIAYGILHNIEDSEDAVHQAFLTIANNFEKIKSFSCQELPSYIVIIIRNTSINLYNKNKRNNEMLSTLDDNNSSFEINMLANYEYEQLLGVISSLSENYKEVLYLYYINNFTTKEISKMLDISVDNVWKRIERAKKQLKAKLEVDEKNV